MSSSRARIDVRPAGPIEPSATPPVALTIAGSDSGGGAGIAADLRTFAALGVFGTVAITALTAQDTMKVHGVASTSVQFLDLQIDSVLGDFTVAAAKTGMLATIDNIHAVERRAANGELPLLVVDPVMVATSGAALVEGDAVRAYRCLISHSAVTTPNLFEAALLVDRELNDLDDMADAAIELVALGAQVAVVKGGHLRSGEAVDIYFDGRELVELVDDMVATRNVHGTGCTLSAAIAAQLARGANSLDAVVAAKRYLAHAIRASTELALAQGPGPLDHLLGYRVPEE